MLTLAVTGRSGCGKSTVTARLRQLGAPCADADQIARQVLEPGSPCLGQLADAFGADILPDGVLDRQLLADRAFATPDGTKTLCGITHPEIRRRIRQLQRQAAKAAQPVFVVDGAVIIGTEFEADCDRFLVVTAPFALSVQRICARDGIAPEAAARRLNAQTPEAVLTARADYVLVNDAAPEALLAATDAVWEALRKERHD